MNIPWKAGVPLPEGEFQKLRRKAIFQYHKWDQQVGDVGTFCPFPLILDAPTWIELSSQAERLAAEILAAERELMARPDLHDELGLPSAVLQVLRGPKQPSQGKARLIRFDFHFTTDGWQISEANTDVPGGWNEATGYPELLAPFHPHLQPLTGMIDDYVTALTAGLPPGARVGLIHATAHTEDRQGMVYLAGKLAAKGFPSNLISPDQIAWIEGRAQIRTATCQEPASLLVRHYPSEWLQNLSRRSSWSHFYQGSLTPISNPATALLTQSKRLPLIWDHLKIPMPTWRKFLPACADPRKVDWETDAGWIVKPTLGRIGHDIGIRECLSPKEWKAIRDAVRQSPKQWVAQRRFQIVPVEAPGGVVYPCLGIYTIDGRMAGAYGRIGSRPMIDSQARDVALFLSPS